jgi:hypothetical protein
MKPAAWRRFYWAEYPHARQRQRQTFIEDERTPPGKKSAKRAPRVRPA